MKILVTGGAGYIGSHMVKLLFRQGHEITVLDDLSTGHRDAVPDVRLVEGSLLDPEVLENLFISSQFDVVLHFAGSIVVGESVADPSKYYRNNFIATLNLLDVMVRYGTCRLVFSSTAAIFGNPHIVPIDEAHPKQPMNPYGASKLMVEGALKAYEQAHGIRWVALRYFNAAGADREGMLGERHDPETHLIPLALRATTSENDELTVFGTDYPTPDGTCIRDYVHVMDLCDAHLLAMEHLVSGGRSCQYNLGNGLGYSVLEVIRTVEHITGKKVQVKYGAKRSGDPERLVADSSAIRSNWGWKPKLGLKEIVRDAWLWECRKGAPE